VPWSESPTAQRDWRRVGLQRHPPTPAAGFLFCVVERVRSTVPPTPWRSASTLQSDNAALLLLIRKMTTDEVCATSFMN
jgi:hypothetical protein